MRSDDGFSGDLKEALEAFSPKLAQAAPRALSPAVPYALKMNPPEQKNPPGMLVQFNQAAKAASRVSASDLQAFLKLVAEGEQDKAEMMLKSNRALALASGDIT